MSERLPASVKIGYRVYKIVEWTASQGAAANKYGECSHVMREIRVDLTHGMREGANTLLHEIVHAICSVWYQSENDKEERTVSLISNGLSTVWVDNPDVMEWIARHHRQSA